MAASASCPICGAPRAPTATSCPNCGAKFRALTPLPVEALVKGLEELESVTVATELRALEEADAAAREGAKEALAELAAIEAEGALTESRLEAEEADLTPFVERIEQKVAARAQGPLSLPPRPHRLAAPLLASGGLLGAIGLFLLPATVLVGSFTVLLGTALAAVGAGVYYARPLGQ